MTDLARAYDAKMREMYACTRRIASLTQWGRPHPDSVNGRVLAALEAKRDREAPALDALCAQVAAASARPRDLVTSGDFPMATRKGPIDPRDFPDLPDCLRRTPR